MNYPFENDTERIEKRIAEKSVFSEKNRTFLIRVIILIAAFLLSFSGILLCNATLSTQQIAHVNNTTEAVGTVLGIVIVLLCTAGLAVKNILYVSVLQRVHEFAQLRAIGATYQQIKSVVKKERDKIAKPCIVLGTVIGFLVNIVLPLPNSPFKQIIIFGNFSDSKFCANSIVSISFLVIILYSIISPYIV